MPTPLITAVADGRACRYVTPRLMLKCSLLRFYVTPIAIFHDSVYYITLMMPDVLIFHGDKKLARETLFFRQRRKDKRCRL